MDSPLQASAQVPPSLELRRLTCRTGYLLKQLIRLIGTADCPDHRRRAPRAGFPRGADAYRRRRLARSHDKPASGGASSPPAGRWSSTASTATTSARLRRRCLPRAGIDVAVLEGGIEAFAQAGGPLVAREGPGVDVTRPKPSVWVTRERPKIDRIACPWLIRRFIDPFAVFHFVPAEWVKDVAEELGAIPYDIEGVHYSHRGETCTFDTLISEFAITDPALLHLARIVRGADTARLDLEPKRPGFWRSRSASRPSRRTISDSSTRACRSTTRSMAGAAMPPPNATTGRRRRLRHEHRGRFRSASLACRGDARLRKNRPSVLRRAGRPDRADAPRARRRKTLARRARVSCTRSTTACSCPDRRRCSLPPMPAGCSTACAAA